MHVIIYFFCVNLGDDELPILYKLQDYEGCMKDTEALYCLVDIELNSDQPTELWNRIKVIFILLNVNYWPF